MIPYKVITPTSNCFQVTFKDTTSLWHRKYRYLSLNGLQTLLDKKMVNELPIINKVSEICDDYMIGKQHRKSITKKGVWRATKKLRLVHADICGPILPKSNNGKRYVITFIDNYST